MGLSTLHPLVTAVDLSTGNWPENILECSVRYQFYGIFLKQGQSCKIKYGRQNYDYQDGTLVFAGPGQAVSITEIDYSSRPSGHALLFHPDLLRGSHLRKDIEQFTFFSYALHEALHISEKEREIVLDSFNKIQWELSQGIDRHSKKVILSSIELFLNYCTRFYDRQFITRDNANFGIIERSESDLMAYIDSGMAIEQGVPAGSYFADKQHLSPNYFEDLIKKETGKSALEFIQGKLIEYAKSQMFDPEKTISEIAYELGFKYPQHFTRLFKNKVGCAPNAYRMLN